MNVKFPSQYLTLNEGSINEDTLDFLLLYNKTFEIQ
jgi:hypothetical protein